MARNTLEAVFGALGAGLTGFGRERQQRQEDEQRRRRESDLMRVQMLNMGFDPEAEPTRRSQGLAQAGRTAQAAAPSVLGMPNMSAVGQALSRASQDLPLGRSITVGGERFVQPLSRMPETLAQRQREQSLADSAALAERQAALQAERDERQATQRMKEIAAQTASAERIAGIRTGTGTTDPSVQWRLKLPAASRKRLEDSETAISQVQALRQAVLANPEAVGLKNYVPGAFVDRLDPNGAAVRAQIELIAGEIRNARFGGQLTAQEAQLAMRALPDATQRSDILLSRLQTLEDFMGSRRSGIYRSFGGGNPPPLTLGGDADESNTAGMSAADRLRSGRY